MSDDRFGICVYLRGTAEARVVAAGELDLETAPTLADVLADAARRAHRVTLDLGAVTFLDAPAVARTYAVVSRLHDRLSVVPPAEGTAAMRFLRTVRLDDRLPV